MKLPKKEELERLKELASLGQKIILAVGVWILFCYCLSEKIMPDGLSLGDAMLLVLVTLGFGVVMAIGVVYGTFAALAPTKLIVVLCNYFDKSGQKRSLPTFFEGGFMTAVSIFCLAVFVLFGMWGSSKATAPDMKLLPTLACFSCIGLLLLSCFAIKRDGDNPRKLIWSISLGLMAVILPIATIHPALMNITMTTLGIRSVPGSLVIVSAAERDSLEELAAQAEINIEFCQLPKSGQWATTDIRVVWHGIGTTSFVSLMDRTPNGSRTLDIPLPKGDIQVVRPENLFFECSKVLSSHAAQQP